jgi:FKBP-type peptidyl-prolyl cis-trans isomerase
MKTISTKPSSGMQTRSLLALAAILLSAPLNAQEPQTGQKVDKEIFEAIGIFFAQGSGLSRMDFSDEEIEVIVTGLRKGLKLSSPPPELRALQPKIQSILEAKAKAAQAKLSVKSKAASVAYFAGLAKKPGVLKDPSGFYYEILKEGTGAFPTMEDTVRLHYHGTLIDGTVFDSSKKRNSPASFPMRGVIKGFSGGLTKVKVGGKVRIHIPSDLGYGDNPRPGGPIKPGDTLIFECELLGIMK